MIRKSIYVLLAVFLILQTPNLLAQESYKKKLTPKVSEPSLSVTHHTIQLNGIPLKYTATVGYMLLRTETGRPRANVFFTAYTKDSVEDKSRRPITFAYNGGPGSSSMMLHIGALGPRVVLLDDEGVPPPGPYRLVDNEYSILDVSDVVMVDPVSTGYSRAVEGVNPKEFHGYIKDIEYLGEFIRLYIARNELWASPKFIIGESYGVPRAVGLAEYLQRDTQSIYIKGLILVSITTAGLNPYTRSFQPGNDLAFILALPTYTAVAWFHKKLPSDLQGRNLRDVLDEVEEFALEDYNLALMKGNKLPADKEREITNKLARYTGLSPKYIEQTNMRIHNGRFEKELLRDEHQIVGSIDARFKGKDADSAGERFESDPAHSAISGAFAAMINQYFRTELKYENDMSYELQGKVSPWDRPRYLNTAETLRKVMRKNESLKVHIANGYYDIRSYFADEYAISHLDLNSDFKGRIEISYYESGHMMYIHKPSHAKFKAEIAEFIQSAIPD
jgi:carboxypeptidase C (cathepsin A)